MSKKLYSLVLITLLAFAICITLDTTFAADASTVTDSNSTSTDISISDSSVSDAATTTLATTQANTDSSNTTDVSTANLASTALTATSSAVYVSPTGSDTSGTGTSSNPYQTISKAISSTSNEGTIYLYNGTYSGTGNTGITIDSKNLTITAMDNTVDTIIDGSGTNRLFTITGTSTLTFSGITLQNALGDYGAAIYIHDNMHVQIVNIINCTLKNNIATISGGAIAINGSGLNTSNYSKFIIENSTLTGNTAYSNGGAAYVIRGGLSVRHTNVTNNKASTSAGYGGAIYNLWWTWAYGANFANNTAFDGGAVASNNGGRFYTYYNRGENTVFTNNLATGSGGAIYLTGNTASRSTSLINNTLFYNNSAKYGGAIALVATNGTMTVINSTYAYNTATTMGGAIYVGASVTGGIATSYCALYGNNAPSGKSMYKAGGTCTADYNWWGNNTNPYSSGDINFEPANWVIMDMTTKDNGDTVSITANLNKYTDGTKKLALSEYIPFNDVTFSTTAGSINPTSATLVNGTYTATYYKASKDATVTATIGAQTMSTTITGTNVNLTVNDVSGKVGENKNVTGTVTDSNGNKLTNGNVTLSVSGTNISTVNVTNGTYTIPIILSGAGQYTFYVTYNGYGSYIKTTTAGTITITAIGTKLTIENVQGSLGDVVALNVYVVDDNGKPANGTAKVHIYDQDTIVPVYNGVGTTQYTIIEPVGTYNMAATFTNDTYYESSTGSALLVVTKQKVNITIPDVNGERNENVSMVINVTNRYGNPVTGNIIVNFNGENTTLNLVNGQATYTTTLPNEEGNFNLTVTYPEQGNYSESKAVMTVGVGTTTTILTGDDLVVVYGNPQNYTVQLHDLNGAIITGRTISFTLTEASTGRVEKYTNTTNDDGYAKLLISQTAGTYTVVATYAGEEGKFLPSTTTNTIIVQNGTTNKTVTFLTANKFSELVGAGQNFTGKLTDVNGKPLVGYHINLNLTRVSSGASKIYYVTTDTNGEYQLQINLGLGEYTVQASFGGTNDYASSIAFNTLSVVNQTSNKTVTTLTANKFNETVGAGQNFTDTLVDAKGSPIVGQHIALNLTRVSSGASKIYYVTTDTDGAFQLQINLSVGNYTAQCSYGGTSVYQSSSASNTITVHA